MTSNLKKSDYTHPEHANVGEHDDALDGIIDFLYVRLVDQLDRPLSGKESREISELWIQRSEDGDLRKLLAAHSWIVNALKVHFASLGLNVKQLLDERDTVFAEYVIIHEVLILVIRKVVKDRNVQKECDEEKSHQEIWGCLIEEGAERENTLRELQEKVDTTTKEQCKNVLAPIKDILNCMYMGSIKSLFVRLGSLLNEPAATGAAAATAVSSTGKARAEEIAAATTAKTAPPAEATRGICLSGCSSKGKERASTEEPEGEVGGASKRQRLEKNVGPAPEAKGNADTKADFEKAHTEMKTALGVAFDHGVDGETIGKWQEFDGILDKFLLQFGSRLPSHTDPLDKKKRVSCLVGFLKTIELKDKAFHANTAKKDFVQSAIDLLPVNNITFDQFQGNLVALEYACDSAPASSQ